MQPFIRLDAIAAPFPMSNVDTDKILAAQFLKTITREGLGEKLFWSLRQNPEFVLNRTPWDKAGILVALDNFGCGSSREHAPWALLDFGIRCVIAPSFADIFYNNCIKNGILPVTINETVVRRILRLISDPHHARIIVDLENRTLTPSGCPSIRFEIEPGHRQDLLEGVDEIGKSLQSDSQIAAYEARRTKEAPWITPIDAFSS